MGVSMVFGGELPFASAAVTATNIAITATTTIYGTEIQAEEAATITTLGVRFASVTGTPGPIRIGMETIGTDGRYTGTYLGGSTNYVDFSNWAGYTAGTFATITLPTSVTLTRGQVYVVTFRPQGTWNASNQASLTYRWANTVMPLTAGGYSMNQTSKIGNANLPCVLIRSATTAYGWPIENFTAETIGNNVALTNDEVGLKFTIPTTYGTSFKIRGFRYGTGGMSAALLRDYTIYDSTGTSVIQQYSGYDSDYVASNGAATGVHQIYFTNTTLPTLNMGTEYLIAVKTNSTASSGDSVTKLNFNNSTDYKALCSEGNLSSVGRKAGGSWSALSNNAIIPFHLLIDSITVPSGGSGGLLVHPGTAGGMRG